MNAEKNIELYENLYRAWRGAIKDRRHFSKSSAYTNNVEYQAIVRQGADIIPFLMEKLRADQDLDFFLVDAVIAILGIAVDEDCETDYACKVREVLRRSKR